MDLWVLKGFSRRLRRFVRIARTALPRLARIWSLWPITTLIKCRLRLPVAQRYAIDPTKITNALGWYPETKFEVGIVKTIEWYLNNQPWVEEVTSGDYQGYYEKMYGK